MKWYKNLGTMAAVALIVALSGCDLLGDLGSNGGDGTDAPPRAVNGLSAEVGDGQVTLTWSDPADADLASIRITWDPDGVPPTEVSRGTERFTATGLTNGTQYIFTVVAVDQAGKTSSTATATATPVAGGGSGGGDDAGATGDTNDTNGTGDTGDTTDTTPPASVASLAAQAGDAEVTLTWSDPADADLASIRITWDPEGTTPTEVAPGTESFTPSGLTNGTAYTFTLESVDTAGNASPGVTASATPKGSDNARLSDLTLDGATVSGFDPDSTAYSAARPVGTSQVQIAATTEDSVATVSGNLGAQNVSTGANTFSVTVTAADGTTTRTYTIEVAVEASAESKLTDLTVDGASVAGFSSETYSYVVERSAPTTVNLAATPADAQATVAGTGSQSVGAGRTAFDIVVSTPDGTSTATYTIEVQIAPSAPTGLSTSDGTDADAIGLTWNEVGEAEAYTVYRRVAGSSDSWSDLGQVSTATYSDQSSTAASGAVYEYEVTASLDGLESGRSNRDSGFAGSDLEIAISFDDPDNPSISIDAPATVAQGTALSVSASTGYVSYTWYLDGSDSHAGMTGSGSSISVETDGLTTGVHTLSLVVSDGANIYSAGVTFTVES